MKTFLMTRDRYHLLVPLLVTPLLLLPLLGSWAAAHASGRPLAWLGFGTVLLSWVLLAVVGLMAPRALRLTSDELIIERFFWPSKHLPFSSLKNAEAGPEAARFIRLAGVGGWFWSGGLFWARGVGRVRAWITRLGPTVLIQRTKGLPILLGADDSEGLLAELQRRTGSARA